MRCLVVNAFGSDKVGQTQFGATMGAVRKALEGYDDCLVDVRKLDELQGFVHAQVPPNPAHRPLHLFIQLSDPLLECFFSASRALTVPLSIDAAPSPCLSIALSSVSVFSSVSCYAGIQNA